MLRKLQQQPPVAACTPGGKDSLLGILALEELR